MKILVVLLSKQGKTEGLVLVGNPLASRQIALVVDEAIQCLSINIRQPLVYVERIESILDGEIYLACRHLCALEPVNFKFPEN